MSAASPTDTLLESTHVGVLPRRTLTEQLGSAFLVFRVLVAASLGLTALSYGVDWLWLTPELERSRLAVPAESAAHAALLNQRAALHGYLSTGEARWLESYARGDVKLARANKALGEYVGSVPELRLTMLGTRLAEERWRERWAKAVLAAPAVVAPTLAEGNALFDAYLNQHADFATALDRRSEILSRYEQEWIGTRVIFNLAILMAVLVLAARQLRALRRAIVAPVAALLRRVRRIRDGQLELACDTKLEVEATGERTDYAGPRELAELADGLNEMVRALGAARADAMSRDQALREHAVRLRQILEASREFSESLNLKYVVGAVRDSTAAVCAYEHVIVWLMNDAKTRLIDSQEPAATEPTRTSIALGHGLAGRAAKSGRITFEAASGQVQFTDSTLGEIGAIAVPLIVGARVVGALEGRYAKARIATTDMIEVLEMLATHAATAIESARLHAVVEERSHVDALTQLLNRRRLDEDLDAESQRCVRYGRPMAFVMLDVDHFKAFNDTHGHSCADTALQEVARVIAGSVRTTDTAYRYGGEEFCILLRETCAHDAVHFAERIRQRIEQRFASGEMSGITASFGVAEFCATRPTPRALVDAADAAMYVSKHAGRNRVTSVPPRADFLLQPSGAS